jgi:hypothetical protein
MPATLSPEEQAFYRAYAERVWNALIPKCAVKAEVKPWGVRYLHPTKGYKTVGKKRFGIRGVM